MAIYKNDDAYGIEIEREGKTLRLMQVIDGGDPLGENLLACPYLNANLQTVKDNEKEFVDFENTKNEQCFFWEVSGDKEKSQKNFEEACTHYHNLYGIRGCIFDNMW